MKELFLEYLSALIGNLLRRSAISEKVRLGIGRIEAREIVDKKLTESEFQVFSQFGEDGIIEKIIQTIDPIDTRFVEFGVEDYTESNTRFLLQHRNWKGLIIDGSRRNIRRIRKSELYWKYYLRARQEFVTAENINGILEQEGFTGQIGLLSIDVDGNDYWIWKSIEVIIPSIVVVEYNSLWGSQLQLTTPYSSTFNRTKAHFSNQYFGASAEALTALGRSKGYKLVHGNREGTNLFFVHERHSEIQEIAVSGAHRPIGSRQARDRRGRLTFEDPISSLDGISEMPLVDPSSGDVRPIREILTSQRNDEP